MDLIEGDEIAFDGANKLVFRQRRFSDAGGTEVAYLITITLAVKSAFLEGEYNITIKIWR